MVGMSFEVPLDDLGTNDEHCSSATRISKNGSHAFRAPRRRVPQAARSCLILMSDSAGIPSPLCSRQIILSVSERRRLRTSCTRLRLPMKGIRSRG